MRWTSSDGDELVSNIKLSLMSNIKTRLVSYIKSYQYPHLLRCQTLLSKVEILCDILLVMVTLCYNSLLGLSYPYSKLH